VSVNGQAKTAEQLRAELEATLDEIEDRFNVKKQLGRAATDAKQAFDENPVPFVVGGAATAVLAVAGLAWAIVKK
jgi:hypothetical protein